jgi:peptide deformylase
MAASIAYFGSSLGRCKGKPVMDGVDVARPDRYIAIMTQMYDASPIPILIAPNAVLKAKARRIADADADAVRALIPRMFAAMYDAPGIGLAAPQVGVSLRLAIIDLQADDKRDPMVMVNPEIMAASKELATREEGCLSLPAQYADVTRPARVRVRFEDADGVRAEIEAEGLLAACLQHEIDHLNGVLFVDHVSALKRNMIMRKLAKEQKLKADKAF